MDWRRIFWKFKELVGFLLVLLWEIFKFLTIILHIFFRFVAYVLGLLWSVAPEYVLIPLKDHAIKLWNGLTQIYQEKRRGSGTTNYCPQLVRDFRNLAKQLAPSRKFIQAGHRAKEAVFAQLKGYRCEYKVARTKLAGSMGKGTGISFVDRRTGKKKNPDFDLVVFINNAEPPFHELLIRFKQIVESIPGVVSVKKSNISVQFLIYDQDVGEIKFDLLPAKNHVLRPPPSENVGDVESRRNLEDVMQRHIESIQKHQRIENDGNRLHSSSFCERTVEIIKERVEHETCGTFYLNVVRLAKYWNCLINLEVYVPARSCMIELIAVWSQRGKPKRCLIGGFRRFLEKMSKFSSLVVQIGPHREDDTDPMIAQIQDCFRQSNVLPIIMDVANPYNNLAYGIDSKAVRMFEKQARKTIQVLDSFKRGSDYESVENVIDEIFYQK